MPRISWLNPRVVLLLSIAISAVFIDQLTKQIALANLVPNIRVDSLGSVLGWRLVFNDSAAFSLGFGITWLFTLFSTVAVLLLLWFARRIETRSWAILGGFLLGGVTGNLIDRCFRSPGFPNGHVVDFIQIPFGFPIFNIADCCITITMTIVAVRVALGHPIGKAKQSSSKVKL